MINHFAHRKGQANPLGLPWLKFPFLQLLIGFAFDHKTFLIIGIPVCSVLGMSPLPCCSHEHAVLSPVWSGSPPFLLSSDSPCFSLFLLTHVRWEICFSSAACWLFWQDGKRKGWFSEQASTAGGEEQGRDGDRVDEALSSVSGCRVA